MCTAHAGKASVVKLSSPSTQSKYTDYGFKTLPVLSYSCPVPQYKFPPNLATGWYFALSQMV